uniref:Antimicrobial peptide EP-20 n=1 Tax=Xenorhabdus budapestensis TaxID=290110 RepID=AMP20_XENBU|nr:RecName: Full=Antimicrobial peptide EP-20 [Xenorhabdus budapestensis]
EGPVGLADPDGPASAPLGAP